MTSRYCQIVEDNLKALESLAVVGLVPKVMTILETRGAWEEEMEGEGEGQGEVAAEGLSSKAEPEVEVEAEAGETKQQQQQEQQPRESGSNGGPKVSIYSVAATSSTSRYVEASSLRARSC